MQKVSIFIVGQPKSGTTALYEQLLQHPKIYMTYEKEPEYFSTDFHKESDAFHRNKTFFHYRTPEEYKKLFSEAPKDVLVGESSTHYLFSMKAAKNIHAYNPKAKIIMLLREPTSFLHSLHSQYVFETSEDEEDFTKALELEGERKKGNKIPPYARCPSFLHYKSHLNYYEHLKRFFDLFPKEQLHVILFEEYKEDNVKTVQEVYKFLGIQTDFVPKTKTVNPNKVIRSKFLYSIIQYPALKRIVRAVVPWNWYERIKQTIFQIFVTYKNREAMSEVLRKKLQKEFVKRNKKLSTLIGTRYKKLWKLS